MAITHRKRSRKNIAICAENENQKKLKNDELDVFRKRVLRWTAKSLLQNQGDPLPDGKMPAINNQGKKYNSDTTWT